MDCRLCETESDDLGRVCGLALCSACRGADPTARLVGHHVEVEWDTRLKRFSAGVGIAGQVEGFELECKPELWYHKLQQVVSKDFRVGDPAFDHAVWVRTSDSEHAAELLANAGMREALLALLGDVRANELAGNHVTLKGPTLTISIRPRGGLPESKIRELQIVTAALALHLRASAK